MLRTIYEHEVGLRFHHGKVQDILGPGRYWAWGVSRHIIAIDGRQRVIAVGGQDVMTKDGGTLRLSLVLGYRVADVKEYYLSGATEFGIYGQSASEKVATGSTSPHDKLRTQAQLLAREWIAARNLAQAIEDRGTLGEEILPQLRETALLVGLNLESVKVLDMNVTGNLRAAYADVLKSELEGQSALQRARNESATMRSLVNTARLIREHPGLLELRALTSGQKPRVSFFVGTSQEDAAKSSAVQEDT